MSINQRQFFRCHLETRQPSTVLVVGRRRLPCELVEMSLVGFAVTVHRALPSLKDSMGRLKVGTLDYIVRIARQESRDDGMLLALEKVEEVLPNNALIPSTPLSRLLTATAWAAAVGLVMAAIYCMTSAYLPALPSFWG